MHTLTTTRDLRRAVAAARASGKRVALVPTMGNLHEGHLQLVDKALEVADCVVVSVFVNPLQFGPGEDLATYPRTLAADKEKLFARGAHYLFAPSVEQMYPAGLQPHTQVQVPQLSNILCGASRPGHFAGVATVVCKLFNLVQPDAAVFGEKDYQQLLVIRRMVADLCLPIDIIGVRTARDVNGLALSSRNRYLGHRERSRAPRLHQVLLEYREAIGSGFDNYADLEKHAVEDLRKVGFEPEYFSIRDASTLGPATPETEDIVILAAARLGRTRLIDNVTLAVNPASDWGMLAVN